MAAPRSVIRIISLIFLLLGAGLITVAVGLYAYAGYEQSRIAGELVTGVHAPPPIEIDSSPTIAEENDISTDIQSATDAKPTPSPTPNSPVPTPTLTPQPGPASWIRIPKIGVDSQVVEAKIRNGEWEVPKFLAGHLEGTADPGESGNVVLTGHVQSLAGGNVFARIGELRTGDKIFLYVGPELLPYLVEKSFVVKNDDLSVVQPTPSPILTLITCTGLWNPITRDYTERLIVVASPVSLSEMD